MKRELEDEDSREPLQPPKRLRPDGHGHVLKVLCPEALTKVLLGPRGETKDAIQNDTHARLMFSNRGDYYPQTWLRVLALVAEDASSINKALEHVVAKLVESAEEERERPAQQGSELLGRDPGEYVMRVCLTKRSTSAVIGTGGTNIKALRSSTGAKVYIENDTFVHHQMVRIIGTPESLLQCMVQVHEFVQQNDAEVDYGLLRLINFSEAMAESGAGGGSWDVPPQHDRGKGFKGKAPEASHYPPREHGKGGKGKGYHEPAHYKGADQHAGRGWHEAEKGWHETERSKGFDRAGKGKAEAKRGPDHGGKGFKQHEGGGGGGASGGKGKKKGGEDGWRRDERPHHDGMDAIAEVVANLPPGTVDLEYRILCELSYGRVQTLLADGRLIAEIEAATGAKVWPSAREEDIHDDLEEPPEAQPGDQWHVVIQGSLLSIYAAHATVMKALRDLEHEEEQERLRQQRQEEEERLRQEEEERRQAEGEEGADGKSIEALQAKVAELQAQLAEVVSSQGGKRASSKAPLGAGGRKGMPNW